MVTPPVTMPENPFHKEIFPDIHHKPAPSQPVTLWYPEPAFPDLSLTLHSWRMPLSGRMIHPGGRNQSGNTNIRMKWKPWNPGWTRVKWKSIGYWNCNWRNLFVCNSRGINQKAQDERWGSDRREGGKINYWCDLGLQSHMAEVQSWSFPRKLMLLSLLGWTLAWKERESQAGMRRGFIDKTEQKWFGL